MATLLVWQVWMLDFLGADMLDKLGEWLAQDVYALVAFASTAKATRSAMWSAMWEPQSSRLSERRPSALRQLEARVGAPAVDLLTASPDWRGRNLMPQDIRMIVSLCVHELRALSAPFTLQLDGDTLPVLKLKGTQPVETLDLSKKKLGRLSSHFIAGLLKFNASITQVCHFRKVCLHALYVSITYPSVVCSWIS